MDTLKLKTRVLYWSITAFLLIPALMIAFTALLSHLMPRRVGAELCDELVRFANGLSNWRRWTCEDFYRFRKLGYRLTIEG